MVEAMWVDRCTTGKKSSRLSGVQNTRNFGNHLLSAVLCSPARGRRAHHTEPISISIAKVVRVAQHEFCSTGSSEEAPALPQGYRGGQPRRWPRWRSKKGGGRKATRLARNTKQGARGKIQAALTRWVRSTFEGQLKRWTHSTCTSMARSANRQSPSVITKYADLVHG